MAYQKIWEYSKLIPGKVGADSDSLESIHNDRVMYVSGKELYQKPSNTNTGLFKIYRKETHFIGSVAEKPE